MPTSRQENESKDSFVPSVIMLGLSALAMCLLFSALCEPLPLPRPRDASLTVITSATPLEVPYEASASLPSTDSSGISTDAFLSSVLDAIPTPTAPQPLSRREQLEELDKRYETIERRRSGHLYFWQAEDEVLRKMPLYDTVRDQYRAEAEAAIAVRGAAGADALLALAQRELDAFWDDGSLSSRDSYPHGYLARAILELAVENDPDNFRLLYGLAEAITTTMPAEYPSFHPNKDAAIAVWPPLNKMKELIMSGRVEPSPDAMLVMYDWAHAAPLVGVPIEDTVSVCQWLVDNADNGGWANMKGIFTVGRDSAKDGKMWAAYIRVLPQSPNSLYGDSSDEDKPIEWANARRLALCRGSKAWREKAVPVWGKATYP